MKWRLRPQSTAGPTTTFQDGMCTSAARRGFQRAKEKMEANRLSLSFPQTILFYRGGKSVRENRFVSGIGLPIAGKPAWERTSLEQPGSFTCSDSEVNACAYVPDSRCRGIKVRPAVLSQGDHLIRLVPRACRRIRDWKRTPPSSLASNLTKQKILVNSYSNLATAFNNAYKFFYF